MADFLNYLPIYSDYCYFFEDFKTREFLFFSRKFRFLGHILSFDRFANFPKHFFDRLAEFSDPLCR
ncbi:hypothetical protein LEP1GSC047_4408 [Leptospira inadai serovar Lyme str. 10]|uniref:Uncharacterized protein n=2 Tax=Leptospira inadai serovar Lyme TaxID=293084 RepID=V6HEU0_9LEPT|nr:hypothetical protein LEP1GSC047_4408 [Leptospira inadai serovar Lyme str. 10]PNV71229.1 hypothetical protein BES34_021695 [Leptospira inadai serovar Lyme]